MSRLFPAGKQLVSLFALVVVAMQMSGCMDPGVRPYTAQLPHNLHLTTHADTGSAFKGVSAELDIHVVGGDCQLQYEGRIFLDRPEIDVGMPIEQLLYLDFIFASKAMMSSTVGVVRYSTLLKPRANHQYRANVSYDKGIYQVVIQEVKNRKVVSTLPRRPLDACRG